MAKLVNKEKFYKALEDIFVGAKVRGKGGFINLMNIKSEHYNKIRYAVEEEIIRVAGDDTPQEDDMYANLYSFFSRYFSPNGSLYFTGAALHNNTYAKVYRESATDEGDHKVKMIANPTKLIGDKTYEKVYTAEDDVVLFWKTQNLYYVKSDNLFCDMLIDIADNQYQFDVSSLDNKKDNQKKDLYFALKSQKGIQDNTISFDVTYQEKNGGTDIKGILRAIKKSGLDVALEELERAFNIFKQQAQCDFFINKDASKFLKEQFMLWYFKYLWDGSDDWNAKRINHLKALKNVTFNIIDFFAQFEDELVNIWNKPKFVRNSNYVISLDKINSPSLIKKIKAHKGYAEQVKEWKELKIEASNPKAPIDTVLFKDLESEIISQFDDLDEALDGRLIKSDNYQALNTILPKFREQVQCIYIDPPFNTGKDFSYMDRFQDSTWLSLMENRLTKAKCLLGESGSFYLHVDQRMNSYSRLIMDHVFGDDNFINEIIWNYKGTSNSERMFAKKHDDILLYSKSGKHIFNDEDVRLPYDDMDGYKKDEDGKLYKYWSKERPRYYPDQKLIDGEYVLLGKRCYDVFNDIPSASTSHGCEYRFNYDTQKPEKLLFRVISASSSTEDIIMDFFAGSGTLMAVAHKTGRRWVGIDLGEDAINTGLRRMKEVIAFDKCGISKELPDYKGGGFFKYYELEQYEETLDKCCIEGSSDLINHVDKSLYEQYVFLGGKKLLDCIEVDLAKQVKTVNLDKLYDNIDIAETLSNLTGKWIKSIKKNIVEFKDGTKVDITKLEPKDIKPLIWWEGKKK